MNKVNLLITLAIASLTVGIWALFNMPETEPAWPNRIQGFSFQPMQKGQSPIEGNLPTVDQIDNDLKLLQGKTFAIRTYTVEKTFGEIPRLARRYNINVALGGWLDKRLQKNEVEINRLVELTNRNWRNVVRVIVGNEALLRNDVTLEKMISYLERVRKQVSVPVSTAEPWHVWINNPELVKHVDYIAVHMLPYWEQLPVDKAVGYVVEQMEKLKKTFPDKPVIITEVGWPSNGRTFGGAVASEANEATFLRRFLKKANREGYTYYVMEAFDQPWKQSIEGAVGAYWGVYNVDRQPKFEFSKPIITVPGWSTLAVISVFIAAITFALLLLDGDSLRARGRGFLAMIAFAAGTAIVWIIYDYTRQYLTTSTVIVGIMLMIGMLGVVMVVLIEAHEWAEALWVRKRRRNLAAIVQQDDELPKISIHLPAYNEPADMVIETLNSLAELDYPSFEVLVVDNNTPDPRVWLPVQQHCVRLGERFRFFHLQDWPGFKAGALNFALKNTSPEAEIIAVIDSDYLVDKMWLRELATQFTNDKTAIVQAPQDYRDNDMSTFKSMCYNEYRGFFYIGMITRNERNAIIQHGTMTMIRKSVLEEVGGWGEWCITEDAELGLRIFEAGYDAVYIPKSYGKGLTPDTFLDYKKQRYRWAYGAMQVMKHHIKELLGTRKTKLTRGQRYHFFAGWLPWIADGVNLLFSAIAIGWSIAMILNPDDIAPPLIMFSMLPLTLFVFKLSKLVYLYRGIKVVGSSLQILSASLAGLALSHAVAKAMVMGLITKEMPFYRTPKKVKIKHKQAFLAVREELLLMAAFWLAGFVLLQREDVYTLDLRLWVAVLFIQSIPYTAAVYLAWVGYAFKEKSQAQLLKT